MLCNQKVWEFIQKARELNYDSDEGGDPLNDYITGEVVRLFQWWAIKHGIHEVTESDAVTAFVMLFNVEETEIMAGETDPTVLNSDEWTKHCEKMETTYGLSYEEVAG